ncbi:hypothetical protein EYF80_052866 [Liparis tanakae]|uniref:Uncharacterized protein n=1 Tax=Liparis tanakae TaxID=230148 RepID=A0A4Z2F9G2_9TELE|nr:hypothetical protein EYF80_052866 [Liparis tanakae]
MKTVDSASGSSGRRLEGHVSYVRRPRGCWEGAGPRASSCWEGAGPRASGGGMTSSSETLQELFTESVLRAGQRSMSSSLVGITMKFQVCTKNNEQNEVQKNAAEIRVTASLMQNHRALHLDQRRRTGYHG